MNETITPKELQSLQENLRNLTILDVRRKSYCGRYCRMERQRRHCGEKINARSLF